MVTGQCLCGGVSFEITGTLRGSAACHCDQCRRQSGHVWASANVLQADLNTKGNVRWYEASPKAKRGFCPTCGSFLFWKARDEDTISVAFGALNSTSGLKLERHIFVADKADYYEIADGLPQFETS